MMRSRKLLLVGLGLGCLLGALRSGAQDAPPAPSVHARDGFLIGFSLGYGATFPCDTCADGAGEFHLGAMASPKLAVLAEVGIVGGDDRSHGGLLLATIGVQYWATERVWLKGGLGIGDALDDETARDSDRGWGAAAAVGYEVARKGRFAFDIQARGGFVGDRHSFALNLGFNWF